MSTNSYTQCENGHFYPAHLGKCPYCNPMTESVERSFVADEPIAEATAPIMGSFGGADDIGKTMPAFFEDTGKTVPVMKAGTSSKGIDLPVGWLVSVEGPTKGQDFKVYSGNNGIGRSSSMAICIPGDNTISKENMAFITYDSEEKQFLVSAGTGKNVVRVNGQLLPVSQTKELEAYDKIKLGETVLVFVPFCCEKFNWGE